MILSQCYSPEIKVVLTGEGSDEAFGGYGWVRVDKLLRPLAVLPLFLRRWMLLGPLLPHFWPGASGASGPKGDESDTLSKHDRDRGSRSGWRDLFSADLKSRLIEAQNSALPFTPPSDFNKWHTFSQLQYYELTMRLPNYITHHLDHTTMAHSLEARVPFLDHEFIEFCAGIPPAL